MATLKESNQKAIEFFKNKGKKFLELKGLEQFQFDEKELGDLELAEIRKWASVVGTKFELGKESLEPEIKVWEDQAKTLYDAMQAIKESSMEETEKAKALNDTRIQYEEAVKVLNLYNMFSNILVSLSRSKQQATSCISLVQEARTNIIEAIKSNDYKKLSAEQANFATHSNRLLSAKDDYLEALEAYNKVTSRNLKAPSFFPFTDEEIKAFYYETEKGLSSSKDPKTVEAINLSRTQMAAIVGADSSKGLIEEAQKRVATEVAAAQKEAEAKLLQERIQAADKNFEKIFEDLFAKAVERFKQPNWEYPIFNSALEAAVEQIQTIKLPNDARSNIWRKHMDRYTERIKAYLGNKHSNIVEAIIQVNGNIEQLNKMDVNDPKLKEKYDDVNAQIKKLIGSDLAKEVKLEVVDLGETIDLRFPDPKLGNFTLTPISKVIVEKLTPKKQEPVQQDKPQVQQDKPQVQPVTPVQQDKPQVQPQPAPKPVAEEDLKYYIGLLEKTNAEVREVNDINTSLISHNRLMDLSPETMLHDVGAEVRAEAISAHISELRIELSDKRYDYLKKYGKYIIAEPEVKDKKIEEIRFNANFEEFVNDRDNLIADAEVKILELNNTKPNGYEKEIQDLKKFIQTQNSLVSRFLVAESVSRRIDIIAFQKQRLQNRTAIIESKKAAMAQGKQPGEPVQPTQKPKPANKPAVKPEPTVVVKPEEPAVEEQKRPADIQVIKYKEAKLTFNPRKSKEVDFVIQEGDILYKNNPPIVIDLIKNGIRVRMSQELRERLAALNAKISLVNNKVKQSRTSQMVDANAEEQEIAFKKDHDDIGFDNYSVEIRIPGKNKSQILYAEEVPTEEQHMSR